MSKSKNIFLCSVKEFCNLRSVVTMALLVALHTVMSMYLSVMVTESLRISLSFLANIAAGVLYGPVAGFVCGGIGDLIQFILKPQGAYFPGFTLSAALAGFVYGMCLYKKFPVKKTVKEEKERKEKDETIESKKERITLSVLLQLFLCICVFLCWFILPFGSVIDKASGESLVSGSAFFVVKGAFSGQGGTNLAVVSVIFLAAAALAFVAVIKRRFAVSLTVSVIAAFLPILAVYTDKKTTDISYGFVVMAVIFAVLIFASILELAKKHQMDGKILIGISITLVLETFFINILLGTYWLSVMYGKGFWFYFTSRFIKNIVQLPVNIMLTYYLLGILGEIRKRVRMD